MEPKLIADDRAIGGVALRQELEALALGIVSQRLDGAHDGLKKADRTRGDREPTGDIRDTSSRSLISWVCSRVLCSTAASARSVLSLSISPARSIRTQP